MMGSDIALIKFASHTQVSCPRKLRVCMFPQFQFLLHYLRELEADVGRVFWHVLIPSERDCCQEPSLIRE